MNGLGILVLFSLNRRACHCLHATLFAHADPIHRQQCEHFYISNKDFVIQSMLTTILPAATVPALYHTITTATRLYSKVLLFIFHFYFCSLQYEVGNISSFHLNPSGRVPSIWFLPNTEVIYFQRG